MAKQKTKPLEDVSNLSDNSGATENAEAALEAKIRAKFDESVASGQTEDNIKLNMISAGATFKSVTKLFNKFLVDAGMAVSKDDRDKIIEGIMQGKTVSTKEGFDEAAKAVEAGVKGCNDKSAAALVRAFAKKHEMECYAKPKGDGIPRATWRRGYHDWLVMNPSATKEDAQAYINTGSENVRKHSSSHLGVFELVRRVREKLAAG